MKQLVGQMNLLSFLILLLLLSPFTYAQDYSTELDNSDCPTSTKDWKNFEIDDSNHEAFTVCIQLLKDQFMEGKELSYMKQKEMKEVLEARYDEMIKFYNDPAKGGERDVADELKEELKEFKKRKPAKSK